MIFQFRRQETSQIVNNLINSRLKRHKSRVNDEKCQKSWPQARVMKITKLVWTNSFSTVEFHNLVWVDEVAIWWAANLQVLAVVRYDFKVTNDAVAIIG